ncbi:MAG: hypothetical protein DDT22_00984 [candidate division WS2 bacterium]|nr:hypothetical protein [Candidatus Lithacetigena glycinireducens]MBT9175309.1 hypothetical protein [Candidatus Lithacetigena glycinireducens]
MSNRSIDSLLDELWDIEEAILFFQGLMEKYSDLTLEPSLKQSLKQLEIRRRNLIADLQEDLCGDERKNNKDLDFCV